MKLTDIDLHGLGSFSPDPATFICSRYNLPERWDYVYTNGRALLRVHHDGTGYLQLDPPGGPALLRLEREHLEPNLHCWIVPEKKGAAFSNFWKPHLAALEPDTEPDAYTCTFAPDAARYHLKHDGWTVDTELWVAPDSAAVIMTVAITNDAKESRTCTLMPVVKPHMATLSLAPWDVPSIYQTCAYCRTGETPAFWLETRNPGGDPSKRLRAAVVTDLAADSFEVSLHDFVGHGSWSQPAAAWSGTLARDASGKLPAYGKVERSNAVIGQPPVAALAKKIALESGERFEFSIAFGKLSDSPSGKLPPAADIAALARLIQPATRRKLLAELRRSYGELFALRSLETPDAALNRYVNEFLPLQLSWVSLLDRGWPTGMRGVRDAAQDATGMVALDAAMARKRLSEIFGCQRADGWFLRQFSTAGPKGAHDARAYVDSGMWVWELLWEYLCYTRDFKFLSEKTGWLDQPKQSTILEHALQLLAYYLNPANRGEHGLVKIRAGDWNDSVNLAGVEGRGESVMVSCQVVLGLEQAAELLDYLPQLKVKLRAPTGRAKAFRAAAEKLRLSIQRHALNSKGYFNAVFNDAGKWIFSPKDPDGHARINGPANSFAVIAGIAPPDSQAAVFAALNSLKGPHGWRLFHPPIGTPPIAKLGRIGAGDLAPGMGENGTPYNHGSQGFLGRAAWTAGRGTLLYDALRYMLPYDQAAHPIMVSKTAPYGVVNHWREALALEGSGGDTFLSGSISTAIRNVYQGLVGFRPELDAVVIDPCLPTGWKQASASVTFLGAAYEITISNPEGVECGVAELKLNGRPSTTRRPSARLGRTVALIPIADLKPGRDALIEVRLGKI